MAKRYIIRIDIKDTRKLHTVCPSCSTYEGYLTIRSNGKMGITASMDDAKYFETEGSVKDSFNYLKQMNAHDKYRSFLLENAVIFDRFERKYISFDSIPDDKPIAEKKNDNTPDTDLLSAIRKMSDYSAKHAGFIIQDADGCELTVTPDEESMILDIDSSTFTFTEFKDVEAFANLLNALVRELRRLQKG